MPDIPSSPRKTVSSASANARAQQPQKKPGAPKPKGAVRAKSGCYTCRIRRKKCDEQPNPDGACQTCVRLRLQCLGFGAKRPDWMRENNSVTELREKIKTFLASQGMIKGHSGSGPRNNDGDPPVLVLVENLQTQPSSPPTPTLSAGSNEAPRQQQGPMTSYVRDPRDPAQYHHQQMPPPNDQQHPYGAQPQHPQTTWASHVPELTSHPHPHPHDAPLGRGPLLPNDILYSTQPGTLISSASLVPPLSSSATSSAWPYNSTGSISSVSAAYTSPSTSTVVSTATSASAVSMAAGPSSAGTGYLPVATRPPPQIQSSFSRLYTMSGYGSDDDLQHSPDQDTTHHVSAAGGGGLGGGLPLAVNSYDVIIPNEQKDLVQHYMSNVLPIQYLLSDSSSIKFFIYELIRESDSARDAACMLAAIHRDRTGYYNAYGHPGGAAQALSERLFFRLANKKQFTEGDAMAGLHAVSTILFSGGRGSWEQFLSVASQYVEGVLTNTRFYGPEDVMKHCTESTRFIIKTTMWFDVLASVTTQSVPRFLEVYRSLFDRSGHGYIEDPASYRDPNFSPPETSMLSVMGCENNIVLAIAEISYLAHWKQGQKARNSLSVPKLVERGVEIERKFLTPGGASSPSAFRGPNGLPPQYAGPASATASASMYGHNHGLGLDNGYGPAYGGMPHMNGGASQAAATMGSGHPNDPMEVELRRRLTNDIFRASARLYLHTVLSGDYPSCPEIIESVTDVINCLRRIPRDKPLVSRAVLRSVVFGVCIAGCLTDNRDQRHFLLQLLETQQNESVGNVSEVKKLMMQVWDLREHRKGQPVNWRDVMAQSQHELLLLV